MGTFLLAARLALAAVFATAGVAKLLDQPGSRQALSGFGLPDRIVPVTGALLPVTELAVAVTLIPQPTARWAAVGAACLLVAFMAGIARAIARDEAPDCHCFGQLHSAPAGPNTLARNALLAAGAGVVAWRGPGSAIDAWVGSSATAAVMAAAGVAAAGVLAAIALRLWLDKRVAERELADARAELAALPPGLPVGGAAPLFELPDARGATRTLESLLERGKPVALVFVAPDCEACGQVLPDIARWRETLAEHLTVAVISSGTAEANQKVIDEHAIDDVLLQQDSEVLKAYRVEMTPAAVIVSPDSRIASPPALGAIAIEPLVRITVRRAGAVPGREPEPAL